MPTQNDDSHRSSHDALAREARTTCPPAHDAVRRASSPGAGQLSQLLNSDPEGSPAALELSSDNVASDSPVQAAKTTSAMDATTAASVFGKSPDSAMSESEAKEGERVISPTSPSTKAFTPLDMDRHSSFSESWETPSTRLRPVYTSSLLRAGSKFKGTQQSDKHIYNVEVDIKQVDMAESFLCGYLRIEGLAKDHPTLTTYFEGEIIGPKYTFHTKHESWGATEKTDMQHWERFSAFHRIAKQARRPDFHDKNYTQRENIFMRWKESFLVPDHRVREISGASFEGFYYICFNQVARTIDGIYFHAKSEKFQKLQLKHVEDRGCFGAIEFK